MIKGSTAWTLDSAALSRLLYETGLRQADLAEQVGVAVSTVNQWLTGKRKRPAPADVRKLAEALTATLGREISVEDLLVDPEAEPEPAAVGA
jgi:transcriptional regulator with XRE-family HTH domain